MLRKLLWKAVIVSLISFVHLEGCWAASNSRSVIVDDTYGDDMTGALPTYTPSSSGWQHCSGTTCSTIGDQGPDTSQTMNGTFSVATWSPDAEATEGNGYSVEIPFNGNGIDVYCIIANYIPYVTTLTNVSFTLDGKVVGNYAHTPSNEVSFQYNVQVYSSGSISNGPHTLAMTTVGQPTANASDSSHNSLVIFDYAEYTVEEVASATSSSTYSSTSSSSSSSSTTTTPYSYPTTTSSEIVSHSTTTSTSSSTSSRVMMISSTSNTLLMSSSSSHSTMTSSYATSSSTNSLFMNLPQGVYSTAATSQQSSSSTSATPFVNRTASTRVSTGAIAGGVVGGIVGLLILLLLLWCLLLRRRHVSNDDVLPFVAEQRPDSQMEYNAVSPTTISTQHLMFPQPGYRDVSHDAAIYPPTEPASPTAAAVSMKGPHPGNEAVPIQFPVLDQRALSPSSDGRTSGANSPIAETYNSDLRQQVLALQTQVERIQAEREQEQILSPSSPTMLEPPPNYYDIQSGQPRSFFG